MKNKTKRLHPLSALDRHSGPSPDDKPVGSKDRKIDDNVAGPFEKCRKRYAGDVVKQLEAFEACNHRKRRAQKYLDYLQLEIKQGYLTGLDELAFIARSATLLLEQWAKDSPEYVSGVAQYYGSWPLLCMRNTPDNDQRELLKNIKLDYANIDGLPAHRIGHAQNSTRMWAFRLLKALQDYRRPTTKDDLPKEIFRSFVIVGGSNMVDAVPQLKDHRDLCEACLKLPPFGSSTEPKWWGLAEDLLLRISQKKPWTLSGLAEVSNPDKVRTAKNNGWKTDGLKRDAVLKTLRSAFKTLARMKER